MRAALKDITTWSAKLADPNWCNQIDADLVPPPEVAGSGGEHVIVGDDNIAKPERRNAGRRRKYAQAKEG